MDRAGGSCPVAELSAWIECYPWPAESHVVASEPSRVLVTCPEPAQQDGKTRPVWARWRDPLCGEGISSDTTSNADAIGWCQFGSAWWTPENAPWSAQ